MEESGILSFELCSVKMCRNIALYGIISYNANIKQHKMKEIRNDGVYRKGWRSGAGEQ